MKGKKILLIDDEDNLRTGVKIALKKQGCNVVDVADGFEGMRHVIRVTSGLDTFNLILLDIMMPKVSGIDILEYMVHKRMNTPVLVITGYMNYDIKCFCSRLESVQILQKPFSHDELMEKIHGILDPIEKTEETA
ncbi:MAG: response regulator [Deferribacterales bacterium]